MDGPVSTVPLVRSQGAGRSPRLFRDRAPPGGSGSRPWVHGGHPGPVPQAGAPRRQRTDGGVFACALHGGRRPGVPRLGHPHAGTGALSGIGILSAAYPAWRSAPHRRHRSNPSARDHPAGWAQRRSTRRPTAVRVTSAPAADAGRTPRSALPPPRYGRGMRPRENARGARRTADTTSIGQEAAGPRPHPARNRALAAAVHPRDLPPSHSPLGGGCLLSVGSASRTVRTLGQSFNSQPGTREKELPGWRAHRGS